MEMGYVSMMEKRTAIIQQEHGLPSERFHEEVSRRVPMGDLIRSIQEDANGDIIIHSAEEIFKFNRNTITVLDRPAEHTSVATIKNPRHWKMELDKLWFQAENNNGAYTYANGRLQHWTLPPEYLSGGGSAFQYATYALLKDRKNNIWLGTAGAGIMKFDGQTFTCINANKTKGTVRSIFEDNNGRIWISNVLQGLNYYEKDQLVNFTKEIGYYTLSEIRNNGTLDGDKYLDGIQTIEQDEKGNMWFGSYSEGLWRYDGKNLTHFTTANGLPSNTVKTIYKINTGELIFGIGLESSGIYRFDGEGFVRM